MISFRRCGGVASLRSDPLYKQFDAALVLLQSVQQDGRFTTTMVPDEVQKQQGKFRTLNRISHIKLY